METLASFFALAGLFFHAVAAVGVVRFPDVYSRGHALGTADSLGALFLMLGVGLYHGPTLASLKLVFVVLFLYIANPAATHAVMRAALRRGVKPWQAPPARSGARTR